MRKTLSTPRQLPELIQLYLLRCQVEGKSDYTVRAYGESLRRFVRALDEDGAGLDASAVTAEHIYGYLGRFANLSLDTRHRYFREVRCFYNWLVEAGYVERSPFQGLRNVRLPQKIVRPFTAEDVRAILGACEEGAAGRRDRAIVMTLLDTGLRVSELAQLTLDDLDLEDLRLRVLHAKGNKQRVVPFSTTCKSEIERYLKCRGAEPGPLFCASSHGNLRKDVPLQTNGVKHLLRRLGKKTGLAKVHAHRFRHSFATWAIQQGARELDVQLLLGHSSPDMVRRYTSSYNSEQAARRHHEFSPLARLS
jgi:integrase/recombinase XerC